uniref:BCL2 interacting protein like n=1 Tax=Gopherus evgoodei TaxID=1825980 RepID=A0A8C4YEZ7_9SAUR
DHAPFPEMRIEPDSYLSLDRAEGSVQSGDYPECTPDGSLDINVDELETPSESELPPSHPFPSADELPRARRLDSSLLEEKLGEGRIVDVEDKDGRKWRIFLTDEREQKVDLSVVEPYKRVISHGGYYGEGLNAIILFASCYLPHSSIPDYQYVMEHLFRYIIGTLEVMVAESYILVCLNGATLRSQIPSFGWIKQCYQTIDRRLRKNLKAMIIVHPTWYIKALMVVFRPFLSGSLSPYPRNSGLYLGSSSAVWGSAHQEQSGVPVSISQPDTCCSAEGSAVHYRYQFIFQSLQRTAAGGSVAQIARLTAGSQIQAPCHAATRGGYMLAAEFRSTIL